MFVLSHSITQVQPPKSNGRLSLFSQMIHFSLNYLIYSCILYFSSFAPLVSSNQYQGYSQQFVLLSGIPVSLFLPDGTLYRLFSFLISIYGILHSITSCLGLCFPATVQRLLCSFMNLNLFSMFFKEFSAVFGFLISLINLSCSGIIVDMC